MRQSFGILISSETFIIYLASTPVSRQIRKHFTQSKPALFEDQVKVTLPTITPQFYSQSRGKRTAGSPTPFLAYKLGCILGIGRLVSLHGSTPRFNHYFSSPDSKHYNPPYSYQNDSSITARRTGEAAPRQVLQVSPARTSRHIATDIH